jgi:hypothetical protein
MQLSIEIPEQLGFELKTIADTNEFIIHALQKALEENKRKQAFKQALADMQQQASDNVRILAQSCHQFQANAATHSISKLPLIPVNVATPW